MPFVSGRLLLGFSAGVVVGGGATFYTCARMLRVILQQLRVISTNLNDIGRDVQELKDRLHIQNYKEIVVSAPSDDEETFFAASAGAVEVDEPAFIDTVSTGIDTVSDTVSTGIQYLEKEKLFITVDELLEGHNNDKHQAHILLDQHIIVYSADADYLWRRAKTCYAMSGVSAAGGDEEKKREFLYASRENALAALAINPENANVQKWCAISIGVVSEYEGLQQKIENGFKIKEHIEAAIRLDSNDYGLHYMLGRWCYEVYMLTWLERKIAATCFAEPPTSTVEDALKSLMECERLKPKGYKANMLYIAKCYIEMADYENALSWLGQAQSTDIHTDEDRTSQAEIVSLISKYSAYTTFD